MAFAVLHYKFVAYTVPCCGRAHSRLRYATKKPYKGIPAPINMEEKIIRPDDDEWPYTPYKLNEYGLVDNASALNSTKSILNLARFLFFNANDGAFEDIEEAANEVRNIMCGEFYISVEEE